MELKELNTYTEVNDTSLDQDVPLTFNENERIDRKKLFRRIVVGGLAAILGTVVLVQTVFSSQNTNPLFQAQTEGSEAYVQRPMERIDLTLEDPSLTCNDGTPAVYYIRKSSNPEETRWVVRFEGGGSCGFAQACEDRWESRPQDMTTRLEETLVQDETGGILCNDPELNPAFYDYNAVYAHYCSSDAWIGQANQSYVWNDSRFVFLGAKIQWGVWDSLRKNYGLSDATQIIIGTMSVSTTGGFNLVDYWVDYFVSIVPQQSDNCY